MTLSKQAKRRSAILVAGALCALLSAAALSQADITQQGTLRVAFAGKLSPRRLPRTGLAPVAVSLSGLITTTDQSAPPQLRRITMALNRHGRLDARGLPRCHYHQIQPASSAEARAACRSSLIGTGDFEANVALPEQSPFPSDGRVLAFNGTQSCASLSSRRQTMSHHQQPHARTRSGGHAALIQNQPSADRQSKSDGLWGSAEGPANHAQGLRGASSHRMCPVLYAHIYGTKPLPISRLLTFSISRVPGTYRTVLSARLPEVAADWGYVSGLSLNLHRNYRYRGRPRSYLAAGCPAPEGISSASFAFARASFAFEGGNILRSTLTRSCRVRR